MFDQQKRRRKGKRKNAPRYSGVPLSKANEHDDRQRDNDDAAHAPEGVGSILFAGETLFAQTKVGERDVTATGMSLASMSQ